jgi:hypothetical protein
MVLLVFGIGSVVLLAAYLGLLSPQQTEPVFITAYLGFGAGPLTYYVTARIRHRAVLRAYFRKLDAACTSS